MEQTSEILIERKGERCCPDLTVSLIEQAVMTTKPVIDSKYMEIKVTLPKYYITGGSSGEGLKQRIITHCPHYGKEFPTNVNITEVKESTEVEQDE